VLTFLLYCHCSCQVWKDALTSKADHPYMSHMCETGSIASLAFCPYEDVLCCGSAEGVGTLLVPGAGEPNFDSWVANPYQNIKERQQQEVAQLLDKLQPDTICLDPDAVGKVRELWRQLVLCLLCLLGAGVTACTVQQATGVSQLR
jgi:U3 small nucleolar RNA-associated protein 7